MIHIISGQDAIIPIEDKKEFNIPDVQEWDFCPESDTHPRYFEIYVKDICEQAKDKDIWIFTYSAMMIEFFDVLSQYYEVECKFYLNDEDGCLPCENNYLWRIYEPLNKPYKTINRYKIKVHHGETINSKKECCCCNRSC